MVFLLFDTFRKNHFPHGKIRRGYKRKSQVEKIFGSEIKVCNPIIRNNILLSYSSLTFLIQPYFAVFL
jgi:hypothetical protein